MTAKETVHTRDALARPLRDLRISLTDRCNFRCVYCMPESAGPYHFLPRSSLLSFEEIMRVSRICTRLGVEKIRLTGGEPLLRRGVSELISQLKNLDGMKDLAMTTNGFLLSKHAGDLKRAGMDRVTVSLDAVDPLLYRALSGCKGNLSKALQAVDDSLAVGLGVKINCVLMRGVNEDSLKGMAAHFKDHPIALRFIEYMDAGNKNSWDLTQVMTAQEMRDRLQEQVDLDPIKPRYFGEVAQYFQVRGHRLKIGFIQSVSKPFCGSCTRLRLTARGELYTCLFGNKGVGVKTLLQSSAGDDVVRERILQIWMGRQDRYSEIRRQIGDGIGTEDVAPKVEMYQIGG